MRLNHCRLSITLFGLCLFASPVFLCAQNVEDSLDAISEAFFEDANFPGLAVSVAVDGKIVFSEGYGYADLEQQVRVQPGISLFRIGSVSKSMTAMAIGQLVHKGTVNLDAPVQEYVPDFPVKRGPVTTRLVAGHLAGIRHYRGAEFYSQRKYDTVAEGLDIFAADTLLFEPGTRYSYSSYGWNLISVVVENASGIDFLEYMADSVFVPTGMIRTVADHSDRLILNRTRFYVRDSEGFRPAPSVDNSYKWAGGGFLSTAEDLVRFGIAHLDDALAIAVRDEFWKPQQLNSGEMTSYGIGWASGVDSRGRAWVGHNGGSVGGSTRFRIYPESAVVISAITNLSGASFEDLIEQLVGVVIP